MSGRDPVLAIRTRIAGREIVTCRMVHERVRWEQGRVLRRGADVLDDAVIRVPLCSAETRAQRLACGHTPLAGYDYARAV